MKEDTEKKRKTGPDPERVKIDDDWESAIGKALRKERPKEGWPKKPEKEETDKRKE